MNETRKPEATPEPLVDSPAPDPGCKPREKATPEGDGLNPTRYGDWEKNGRCIDF